MFTFQRIAITVLGCSLITGLSASLPVEAQTKSVTLEQRDDRVTVCVDGELFTEYVAAGQPSPILYPVLAAGGQSVIRHYPMRDDADGEAHDHPHHRSVWFAHGDVNGLDYWSGKAIIRHVKLEKLTSDGLIAAHQWMDGDQPICSDQTTIRFSASDSWRLIDYQVTLIADRGPVTMGDTKEGVFAIRTHPGLRIRDEQGNPLATAFNSQGIRGADIWGKPADWVHYQGLIDGKAVAVTMLDHPNNLRHPTLWHARDYGLIAANPFARHDMTGEPAGSGSYTIEPGQSLTLRYGIVVWNKAASDEEIASMFRYFSEH